MDKRTVVKRALEWQEIPYVPWNINFTIPALERLQAHYLGQDLEEVVDNHLLNIGYDLYFSEDIGHDCVRDHFGVVWDRSVDKDIGVVRGQLLKEPSLKGYTFPDPTAGYVFTPADDLIRKFGDRYRFGLSVDEGALGVWTMRGMQPLLMDFYDNPAFLRDLLNQIAEYNIAQFTAAFRYDIDAVMFGDDWGQQHGLQMGPRLWREFIYPVLKRTYAAAVKEGKKIIIHSCGDVDELFDDLVGIGLNCFNPFQPEVMDVAALMRQYRGRLAFYGGLSVQKTLPYGTPEEVRQESRRLLELASQGGYIFSPSHDVPKDVPLENMLAFLEVIHSQPGWMGTTH